MLTIDINKNEGIYVRAPLIVGNVYRNVSRTVHALTTELRTRVIRNKLSGQVLHKRTGHLQQSIQQEVKELPSQIVGTVYSAGDVKYAGIHEFGGTIPSHVIEARRAGSLAFVWKGRQVFFKKVTIPAIKMPERSYLRSTLHEMENKIVTDLQQAAVIGVKE